MTSSFGSFRPVPQFGSLYTVVSNTDSEKLSCAWIGAAVSAWMSEDARSGDRYLEEFVALSRDDSNDRKLLVGGLGVVRWKLNSLNSPSTT